MTVSLRLPCVGAVGCLSCYNCSDSLMHIADNKSDSLLVGVGGSCSQVIEKLSGRLTDGLWLQLQSIMVKSELSIKAKQLIYQ